MGGRGEDVGGSIGAGRANSRILDVPVASRKVVQSLKEVVNCSEQEIYAMLVECNMDPDEAVSRLMSQDTFHEVKSKRDKKKENKDTKDSRLRGSYNYSTRGVRVGSDRYGNRVGSFQLSSNEPGCLQGKPSSKRENGTRAYLGTSSSVSTVMGCQPPVNSDCTGTEHKMSLTGLGEAIPSSSLTFSGYRSAWFGASGQLSMADMVKKGIPQVTHPPRENIAHHSSEDTASKMPEVKDEWPLIEKPAGVSISSVLKASAESELFADPTSLPSVRTDQHQKPWFDEDHLTENQQAEYPGIEQVRSTSVSNRRNLQEDDSGVSSVFDDDAYKRMDFFKSQRRHVEHNGAEDVDSSVTTSVQQLTIENDDREALPEVDKPGVIIPNHLQVHTSDCLRLSFGSFGGSDIDSGLSGTFALRPLNDNLEETSEVVEDSSIRHSDNIDSELYGDVSLGNIPDGNSGHRTVANAGNYDDFPSDSQTQALKPDTYEAAQDDQYKDSSAPGHTFKNEQQLNYAFSPQQTNPQMQNLGAFSNVMQPYTNSLPNALLPTTIQSARELNLQYSPLQVTQSMPTNHNNAATTLSGPAISIVEALRAASISTPQPTHQTLSNASFPAASALGQHLAVHPYSQPTLPLGHYANMIGYPFLPQNYAYMPSAFQQAFGGNSTHHQSLAAMLPQDKNNGSANNLPQSAAVASGYGFGGSSGAPGGNFSLNPSNAEGSTIGYAGILNSQFKDTNLLGSFQQNEISATAWLHSPGSRTISGLPGSAAYYGFSGLNQRPPGFRQGVQQQQQQQQPVGYPKNMYNSQTGISLDTQLQNPRDVQATNHTQHLWHNGF